MPQNEKTAQASLLYAGQCAPLDEIDVVALRAMVEAMGVTVRRVQVQENEFIRLHGDSVDVVVAGSHRPFQMEHFRGVLRPVGRDDHQEEVLGALAEHRSSLTVLVFDRATDLLSTPEKFWICDETVDLLLSTTSPSLVYWCDRNELVTATEAETAIEVLADENSPTAGAACQGAQQSVATLFTKRPAGSPSSLRSGNIDLSETDFMTGACSLQPKQAEREASPANCPAHLTEAPKLSADVMQWFEGRTAEVEDDRATDNASSLRAFLALDDSAEPRRIAETASGRASLYLMSATIAVFALPVGASMLTYNALSGGSFRATSHVMALTGIGLFLTSMGLPSPAEALGF